jgi:hypothetical protein
LIDVCISVVTDIHKDKYDDEDNKHYIYEAAMEAVFGPTIWEWKKKQLK